MIFMLLINNVKKLKKIKINSISFKRFNACQKLGSNFNRCLCMRWKRLDNYGRSIEMKEHFMQVDN